MNAAMDLDDFCERFHIETESESSLLSGWIMEQMEKVPDAGESFQYQNLTHSKGGTSPDCRGKGERKKG